MRIKGRYVAIITIDFDYEQEKDMLPFEDVKNRIMGTEFTKMIKEVVVGEVVEEYGMVNVAKQYADLYKVEEGDTE